MSGYERYGGWVERRDSSSALSPVHSPPGMMVRGAEALEQSERGGVTSLMYVDLADSKELLDHSPGSPGV